MHPDVIEGKRRACEVWATMTVADRLKALQLTADAPSRLQRLMIVTTAQGPKGRSVGTVFTEAQMLRWRGPI